MKIKAIGFDIGGTLVNYNKPLNWSASYKDAIKFMCEQTGIKYTEDRFEDAKSILTKYNTRVNPREKEVDSETLFGEIFDLWNEDKEKIYEAKRDFYLFFQREANLYEDAKELLEYCKENDIKTSVYTDVAYGMDDEFSLSDIKEIEEYIDLKLTSRNVGYRKPNKRGFEIMLEKFKCRSDQMLYIGDEQKDILGAKNVGISSILINRDEKEKNFEQDYTVKDLNEVINIIKEKETIKKYEEER